MRIDLLRSRERYFIQILMTLAGCYCPVLKRSSADRLLLSVSAKSRPIPVKRKHRNSFRDLCLVYVDFYSLVAHMILSTQRNCEQKFTNDRLTHSGYAILYSESREISLKRWWCSFFRE